MSDVSFMTSNRGGRILIHNDFIYRKAKTSDIRTYWRCSTTSCKATLLTENDILKKTSLTQHNHTSHSNKIKRKHFYSELKKDAGRNNVSVPKLYKVHIAKAQLNDEESSSYLPSYSTAKKIVYSSRRSCNLENLERIKLERNSDSPDNKDILLISSDENDNILTHCTEPISKSLEVERSHNPGNLEAIKLDRNGDSPYNGDILLISNDEKDRILTHCTEPISKSLEAERSHNPGNLEEIKLERNGDSPNNRDILLISNDENERILTHCTEPISKSLEAERSHNPGNLEGIKLERNGDSPNNKDILLISNDENERILTHCTEPISKSLEAERSRNPGNLEEIKLERNSDSPDNRDILLISNDENDKILTHCTEPISKSLEAERSHNPGNLEEIKLERNGDSPNNRDILLISNDENERILTHCTEPISKSLEAERSHNPGNLEGIKLERNGDSPNNKDILLISNDENERILTHCTEPISKSLEAERSRNPGNLEEIKLERNSDSPDNRDILLISNDENDKILTHCTEPISKSLEAERSYNPGNLEAIKLDRNGDSLYNGDILLISNDENDKILTHCTEPISKSLAAERSHNPGNLEGIKLDRNGDSLYNGDILFISNDENDRILKMFPVGTKIIDCDFSSEKDYTAELRLKCKSKEEFKLWLRDFENISGDTYRVAKTVPREGKVVLYKAAYRCHHNTYPFSHRVVKAPSKKHTDCAATLNVTIKAFVPGRRNRSRDTLVADYPTIVRIRHNHNHDIDVKAVEYRNLEENVDSSWHLSLQLGKDQAKPEAKNQNNFVKIESVASMCGEQPYTFDGEPIWEELVSGASMCGEQPDSDDEEPVWEEMESHDGMCDEEPDSEDEEAEWEEMESGVGVCGEQPDSGNKEQKREEMELLLNEITAIFKAKFEKSPRDFSDALSSMHKSIRTMKFPDLLSAMHNFGKIHYKTITCQSLCNDQSIHKKNFILGKNQSLPKTPVKSTFILKHDYSV